MYGCFSYSNQCICINKPSLIYQDSCIKYMIVFIFILYEDTGESVWTSTVRDSIKYLKSLFFSTNRFYFIFLHRLEHFFTIEKLYISFEAIYDLLKIRNYLSVEMNRNMWAKYNYEVPKSQHIIVFITL